ncbi:methyltransferase domain [Caudoviricetes sp.]|nr:methyltransferase domain [Caudoviricetes sp.]
MANARGKTVDKTYLSIDNAEDRGFIHRDYIAHCLRWTHVLKRLYERKMWQTARILDVGCGRELPMAKMLYSSKLIPAAYFGVDVGPVNDEDFQKLKGDMALRTKIFENTNFLEMEGTDFNAIAPDNPLPALPNIVTCFEVLEHVEPKMMLDMLEHMKRLTTPDARFFISTPCWNYIDCAANHVNEMLYESLGAAFERHGFKIENVYGTFASIRDYEDELNHWGKRNIGGLSEAFNALREYYDTNFLSCIFAPLFPAQSRNCLWELRKVKQTDVTHKFPLIESIKTPWSSSAKWEDMAL